MYAFQSLIRIYSAVLLFLCASLFPVSSVASLAITVEKFTYETAKKLQKQGKFPLNSNIAPATGGYSTYIPPNSAHISVGNSGSLVLSSGASTPISSTLTYNSSLVRGALSACLQSPACAIRASGTGLILYEGVKAWADVYDILFPDEENPDFRIRDESSVVDDVPIVDSSGLTLQPPSTWRGVPSSFPSENRAALLVLPVQGYSTYDVKFCTITRGANPRYLVGRTPDNICLYSNSSSNQYQKRKGFVPVSPANLPYDGYNPHVSDVGLYGNELLNNEPIINIEPIASIEGATSSNTNFDASGVAVSTINTSTNTNFEITNNNTTNPVVKSVNITNTEVISNSGNIISSSTTVTSEPSGSIEALTEIPTGCDLFDPFCKWAEWTKEPLDEPEPDLSTLISEFEPDEGGYSSGIGSGSCPAPISLNLGIIQQTVEVSYQPFCDFLAMIRPLVIAGAWLISAFMYVGVLRRG